MTELLTTDRLEGSCGDIRAHDLDRAWAGELDIIAKTLKTIGRKIEAINAQHGCPTTFGHSVLRLAAAIGAKTIITPRSEESRRQTGEKFHFNDLSQGQYNVDRAITLWLEKWTKETVTA